MERIDDDPFDYYQMRYLLDIPYFTPEQSDIINKCNYCNQRDIIHNPQQGNCYRCDRFQDTKSDDIIIKKETALKQPEDRLTYSIPTNSTPLTINVYNKYDFYDYLFSDIIHPQLKILDRISLKSYLCRDMEIDIIQLKSRYFITFLKIYISIPIYIY